MKIYYIYHSCFIVETKSSFLIFDYYKSEPFNKNFDFDFKDILNKIMKSEKSIYIFASHSHSDHYNSKILTWSNERNDIYYILSDDIKVDREVENLYFVKQNEVISIEKAKINTFGSTDAGVSFLVNIDNLNIFHAGDLNWWKWNDDTKAEEELMENAFINIINDIAEIKNVIDVAFFPVDNRLEENYLCGGEYFIEKFHPKIFIPMHFWNDFDTTNNFIKSQSKKNRDTRIIRINYSSQILINEN